ncbi:MAG: hypothetical protein CMN78_04805 [Spirochaetales bacterium]|nr:hypothetical protein [Spirochaetales bacterium]
MNLNWKLPSISGGAAFVLSLLAGVFGGVGFGTILIRGFLGGVIFATLSLGVDYLLRKFIPDMFQAEAPAVAGAQGSKIDITIDEDIPRERSGDDNAKEDSEESLESELEQSEEVTANLSENAEIHVDDDGSAKEESTFSAKNLPSFDSLEDTFADTINDGEEAESAQSGSSIDVLGAEEDPAIVAEAVRTLMKRDQEG